MCPVQTSKASPRSSWTFSASIVVFIFFFFNDTATTEIYTLSLHDALPISPTSSTAPAAAPTSASDTHAELTTCAARSEEHTSELQSHVNLVCRLLLEKKKQQRHDQNAIANKNHYQQ